MTYLVRNGTWESVPACEEGVGWRTPLGLRIDEKPTAADSAAMATIGPCKARRLTPVGCGLMTRANLEGTWCCGVWEATSHVTNHGPADCLRTIVNIGDTLPRARRAIRGNGYGPSQYMCNLGCSSCQRSAISYQLEAPQRTLFPEAES